MIRSADFGAVTVFDDGALDVDYSKAAAVMEVYESLLRMLGRDHAQ